MRKNSFVWISLVGFLWLNCFQATAQNQESGYGFASDSTESNYQNQDAIGGPKTVGGQLVADNQKKESFFRIPVKVFSPWYAWKAKVQENTGIQIGVNYTAVYIQSSSIISEANKKGAGSGILDIQLGWNAVNRKSGKNKGTLFLKINSRHTYGGGTPPMFHGINESGYYGLPATGFRDYTIRALELNWQQNLLNDKLTIILGKVDPTNYFNFHGLIVPWQSFLGYGASVSGTVNWPDMGLGVLAGYKISDKFYAMGGLTDVRGDIYEDGKFLYGGENFFEGNFFKALELGYVPSMPERYFKKISITYWHTDAYVSAGGSNIASGQGVAFSSHWFFQNKFAPYLRFGFSDGNGENAFYKKDFQLGHGLVFRSHDLLGTAFSWAETNIPDTKNQMTLEVYYRFHLTEHLAITPDFQWIINPTLNPNTNSLTYWGIRARATF